MLGPADMLAATRAPVLGAGGLVYEFLASSTGWSAGPAFVGRGRRVLNLSVIAAGRCGKGTG